MQPYCRRIETTSMNLPNDCYKQTPSGIWRTVRFPSRNQISGSSLTSNMAVADKALFSCDEDLVCRISSRAIIWIKIHWCIFTGFVKIVISQEFLTQINFRTVLCSPAPMGHRFFFSKEFVPCFRVLNDIYNFHHNSFVIAAATEVTDRHTDRQASKLACFTKKLSE